MGQGAGLSINSSYVERSIERGHRTYWSLRDLKDVRELERMLTGVVTDHIRGFGAYVEDSDYAYIVLGEGGRITARALINEVHALEYARS